jgi:phosphatidylinositol alpha-1,6-mannosyltransferase
LVVLKQTKVLFSCTEFPPEPGGIGNHAFGLVKELSAECNVFVLTEIRGTSLGFDEFVQTQLKQAKVIGIGRSTIIWWTYLNRIMKFLYLSRKSNIHLFSGTFYMWLSILSRSKVKKVVIIHGSEIKQKGVSKWLFKRALRRADRIICVSNFTRKKLTAFYSLDWASNKIKVINNGFISQGNNIEVKKIYPGKLLRLITVGGVHKRKGQQNVISAIPGLIENGMDLEYVVVGIPLEQQMMQKLAESLGVKDRITFLGAVSEEEKWRQLHHAHIFLMLSEELDNGDFEGFGIALMEAMSVGVPVIGSKNSGIADAIKKGYGGHLVDPKNPIEIVEAVQSILKNYESYSLNAKNWSKKFTWDAIGQKYLEVLKDLK